MLMSDDWVDMVEVPRQPHLRCPGFILMTLVCLPDPITVAGKGWRDVTSCTVTLLEAFLPKAWKLSGPQDGTPTGGKPCHPFQRITPSAGWQMSSTMPITSESPIAAHKAP